MVSFILRAPPGLLRRVVVSVLVWYTCSPSSSERRGISTLSEPPRRLLARSCACGCWRGDGSEWVDTWSSDKRGVRRPCSGTDVTSGDCVAERGDERSTGMSGTRGDEDGSGGVALEAKVPG